MHLKNIDQNNICVSIVFKAKAEIQQQKLVDPQKACFRVLKQKPLKKIFLHIFLLVKLSAVFCQIKKKSLHPTVQYSVQ